MPAGLCFHTQGATPDGRHLYDADTWVVRRLPLDHAALARERVQRDFVAEECLRFDIADCPTA